jgi:hypothetical protein
MLNLTLAGKRPGADLFGSENESYIKASGNPLSKRYDLVKECGTSIHLVTTAGDMV